MALSPLRVVSSLQARRLLNDHTRIDAGTAHDCGSSVYCGFDPTGPDLHIGNLLAVLGLAHFQLEGYQPIAVVGGATALIGDPSGHSKDRLSLSSDIINNNIKGISNTLSNIFNNITRSFKTKLNRDVPELKTVNNATWYHDMSVIDFMSSIGKHFRMATMMSKDSVQSRLNSPEGISYTEFSYQTFQAYDFLHLHKNHNCWLQLGGADQWGNITAGCTLVHRHTHSSVYGVTLPLVTTAAGDKLSKSAGNVIGLSSSPYHIYQYFHKTADNDVERFLYYFTFATAEEISDIMAQHKANLDANLAQKFLARSATQLLYGEEGYQQAVSATNVLFGGQPLSTLSRDTLHSLFSDAPSHTLPLDSYSNQHITNIFTDIGAVQKGEVSNLLKLGALHINNHKITPEESLDVSKHILHGNITVVRKGKTGYFLIKWT